MTSRYVHPGLRREHDDFDRDNVYAFNIFTVVRNLTASRVSGVPNA